MSTRLIAVVLTTAALAFVGLSLGNASRAADAVAVSPASAAPTGWPSLPLPDPIYASGRSSLAPGVSIEPSLAALDAQLPARVVAADRGLQAVVANLSGTVTRVDSGRVTFPAGDAARSVDGFALTVMGTCQPVGMNTSGPSPCRMIVVIDATSAAVVYAGSDGG